MKQLLPLVAMVMVSACAESSPQLPAAEPPPSSEVNLERADTPTLLRLGDRLAAAGDVRGANRIYQRAAAKDPKNPDVLLRLGDLAWGSGALQQAGAYYDRALAIKPDHAQALLRRARSYIIVGDPGTALGLLDRIVDGGNADAETHASRALALDLMARPVEAQVAYGRAMDMDPENINLRINTALSFALSGDFASSLDILRELVNHVEARAQAREALAMVYALSGQIDSAVELGATTEAEATLRRAFYGRLGGLNGAERAAAVYLRRLPPGSSAQVMTTKSAPAIDETPTPPQQELVTGSAGMEMGEPEPEVIYMPQSEPATSERENTETETAVETPAETQADTQIALAIVAPTQEEVATAPEITQAVGPTRYWAQIASFRNLSSVEVAWTEINTRFGDAVADVTPLVQSVISEEKGEWHRLMAGDFDSQADAKALCAELKTAGVDCVVTANGYQARSLRAALTVTP